jgi:hypothetical protein
LPASLGELHVESSICTERFFHGFLLWIDSGWVSLGAIMIANVIYMSPLLEDDTVFCGLLCHA